MKVFIENEMGASIEAQMDGSVFVTEVDPIAVLNVVGVVSVHGEGASSYYFNPTRIDVPSADGKFHFRLVNPTPQTERLQNIEAAITEMYELIIGG